MHVIDLILKELQVSLQISVDAQKEEIETSKKFKGTMESRYDTFKEEAQRKTRMLGETIREKEQAITNILKIKNANISMENNLFKVLEIEGFPIKKIILSSVSLKDLKINGKVIKVVGVQSPIGRLLLNAKKGKNINFNTKKIKITKVIDSIEEENKVEALYKTIDAMKLPYLRLSLTDKCNANCSQCHNEGQGKTLSANNLSIEDYENLAFMFKDKFEKVHFTGGEPLLVHNVENVVEVFKRYEYKTNLTTNGFLLNEKKQISLSKSGLDNINISFPTFNEKEYKKGFDWKMTPKQIVKNIKTCKDYFENIKLNVVVENENDFFSELERFETFCIENDLKLNPFFVHGHKKIEEKKFHDKVKNSMNDNSLLNIKNLALNFNNEICKKCEKQENCSEGSYALRVDDHGIARPCLDNSSSEVNIYDEIKKTGNDPLFLAFKEKVR
jgi:molybdenum cofactor biosynthesis enzyme MoaA